MTGRFLFRLFILVAALASGFATWVHLPGSEPDRKAFTFVTRCFANPPFFIAGKGTHERPWTLRTITDDHEPAQANSPIVISIHDDPDRLFQSSPPAPIDLAVILTNLRSQGAPSIGIGAVLAWDAPDPVGLAALESALARFSSVVTAAPLSRGSAPEPIPPAFRRASIPVNAVEGDTSSLPVVNRIPLSGVILGNDNSLAGFQSLDSETDTSALQLLARWDDHVVCSFALLTVIQQLKLKPTDLLVRPGHFLQLGENGPVIPIDTFGRLSVQTTPIPPSVHIAASELIDAPPGLLPPEIRSPVIVLDERSDADAMTRSFSARLPSVIAAIASDGGLAPAAVFPRPDLAWDIVAACLLLVMILVVTHWPDFPRNIGFLLLSASCLAIQIGGFGMTQLWLPGPAWLAGTLCAWFLSIFLPHPVRQNRGD